MKRFLLTLAVLMVSITAAFAAVYSGSCGTNVTYTLDTSTGVLKIEGTGAMSDYSSSYAPWFSRRSYVKEAQIAQGVTSIGREAFYACSSLTSIIIPSSLTSIGYAAFRDCSKLTSITIPESVTSIGICAFDNCSSLTSITIPESVTSIGGSAFCGCSSLTTITIPESVTSIGMSTFYGCSSLTSITIPNGVTSIGASAFSGCSSLTSITIPDGVTSIGYYAFNGCSSLTSITIPNSVTSIGNNAFRGCSSLTSIVVDPRNAKYDSRESCNAIIETSTNTLVQGCKSTTIPESVTSIGDYAFYNCSSLTSIAIPESVTSIGEEAFSDTGWYDNQPDGLVYAGLVAYKYKGTMPANTNIVINDGTKGIADYAFSGCSSLTSITIPESVTSIGERAFSGCSSLTDVTCLAATPPVCGSNSFSTYGTLHVLPGYGDAYRAADYWSNFTIVIWENPKRPTASSELVSGGKYIIKNVAAASETNESACFLTGGTSWYSQWSTSTILSPQEAAQTFILTETEQGWTLQRTSDNKYTFISGATPDNAIPNTCEMHIDMGNQNANLKYFGIKKVGDYYRIYPAPINPAYGVSVFPAGDSQGLKPSLFWGWKTNNQDDSSPFYPWPTAVYATVDPAQGFGCDWEFINMDVYEAQKALYEQLFAYQIGGYSFDVTPYSNVYENANATAEELNTAADDLKTVMRITDAEDTLLGATPQSPHDGTSLIVNPDFSAGNINGWTCTYVQNTHAKNVGYMDNDIWTNTFYTYVNRYHNNVNPTCNKFFELWVDTNASAYKTNGRNYATIRNGNFEQTITYLPQGLYKLSCDAIATQQGGDGVDVTGVQFFASDLSEGGLENYINISSMGATPEHVELIFSSTGGAVKIGLRTSNCTANWITADNFELAYYGPVGEDDEGFLVSGTCGENLTWTLNTLLGELEIDGSGPMNDYSDDQDASRAPWWDYHQTISSVAISEGVTSIGSHAFDNCSSLTSITIPSSVTSIGQDAFEGCQSLIEINVEPENTKYDSREDCNAIIETSTNSLILGCGNTIIPNSVTSIGSGAFTVDSSLVTVTCLAITPPTCADSAFSTYGTLHVLPGCGDAYRAADVWQNFTIMEDVVIADQRELVMALNTVAATLSFSDDGTYKWAWDDTGHRLRSTNNGINSSTSQTTIAITTPKKCDFSFDWAVSSESTYDKLTITLDGTTLVDAMSGIASSSETSLLTAGTHIMIVKYVKDSSQHSNEDRAYVSNFRLEKMQVYNNFNLTFMADGTTYSVTEYEEGSMISLPEPPVKDGYTFKGWEGLPEDMLMPSNDLTVTAIFEVVLGDTNGDNEIDVADLSAISSYILGHPSESFVEVAADVNKDNEIDVADISALAYLILHPETAQKAKARKVAEKKENIENTYNTLYADMLQAEAGTDVTLPIMMRNSIEATGFQLDLVLPEGVTLKDAALSNARTSSKRTNLFDYARQTDGTYRILCNSTKGLSFNGHDGEVMILTLHIGKDAELGAQTIALKDMVLTDATGMLREESSLSESTLWVGNATGIHEMANEESAPTYDLQGRQVSKKQKGIVISDGKKIMKK